MLLAFSLLASPGLAAEFSSPEQVLAAFKDEPTIAEVHQMALEYSKTDPHYLDGWMRAAKSAAALPSVTLYYNYKNGLDTDYAYYYLFDDLNGDGDLDDNEGTTLSDSVEFPMDQGLDIDHQASIRATWRLDELVMSSDQIRIINEAQDIVKLRDKVLEDVTRLYFERRRLQVDQLLGNGGELKKRVGDELRLAELTAQIDAYTGGRFSRELPNR